MLQQINTRNPHATPTVDPSSLSPLSPPSLIGESTQTLTPLLPNPHPWIATAPRAALAKRWNASADRPPPSDLGIHTPLGSSHLPLLFFLSNLSNPLSLPNQIQNIGALRHLHRSFGGHPAARIFDDCQSLLHFVTGTSQCISPLIFMRFEPQIRSPYFQFHFPSFFFHLVHRFIFAN